MSRVEKISFALTHDLLASVRDAVKSGDYASSSEVVRDALRDWKERRILSSLQVAEVRRLVAEAEASGFEPHDDMHDIRTEAFGRLGRR